MRITILTVGTRGDVQPFVALGKGLRAAGNEVTLATHRQWADCIAGAGLRFAPVEGSPGSYMNEASGQAWMEHGAGPLTFLRSILPVMLRLLRVQLDDAWVACRGAEALVFTPLAVAGYHIAEKLGLPFCGAGLQPVSATRCFPSPVLPPGITPRFLNRTSHVLVDYGYAELWRGEVNRWRRDTLDLPPVPPGSSYSRLHGRQVPMLYGFSQAVVPRPPDWHDMLHVTGYWFFDTPREWTAQDPLASFLAAGPPPVFVGFGSMGLGDPEALLGVVKDACERAGQRAIVSIGGCRPAAACPTSTLFPVREVPHDWLFPRTAAVVHHGGAGTTAAGLRAGRPTVIVPIVADQFFWAERVHALGAGPKPVPFAKLTPEGLAAAISCAVRSSVIHRRAAELGVRISAEDGVSRGVEALTAALVTGGR